MFTLKALIIICILVILSLLILFIVFTSGNNGGGGKIIPIECEDDLKSKLLYSYGLFSCKPMSDRMLKNIKHNKEVTGLPYFVLGPNEVSKDLKKMEKLVPGITHIYNNEIPRGVGKSDLARMVSLYIRGGMYADLDVEFKTKPVIKKNAVVLYTETFSYKDKHLVRVANYALSSPPEHPFILAVIKEIVWRISEGKRGVWNDKDIIHITGPDVITCVYHEQSKNWKNKQCYVILLDYWISKGILNHKCDGTWRHNKDIKENNKCKDNVCKIPSDSDSSEHKEYNSEKEYSSEHKEYNSEEEQRYSSSEYNDYNSEEEQKYSSSEHKEYSSEEEQRYSSSEHKECSSEEHNNSYTYNTDQDHNNSHNHNNYDSEYSYSQEYEN